ncbi:MAG: 5'-deoxynucleotidase, partial [Clostridia bacterium]|nr:5'-deoxynucleotidase [Clostridia bacterium]
EDAQYIPIVKAADKLTAYLKCVEEERCGNVDFSSARKSIGKIIADMNMPCVNYFMEHFAGSYDKPLDELGRN